MPLMELGRNTIYLGLLLLACGCNAQREYEQIQQKNREDCGELQGSQQEDCLRDINQETYESYKRILEPPAQ